MRVLRRRSARWKRNSGGGGTVDGPASRVLPRDGGAECISFGRRFFASGACLRDAVIERRHPVCPPYVGAGEPTSVRGQVWSIGVSFPPLWARTDLGGVSG